MVKQVRCINNEEYEDALTINKIYLVTEERPKEFYVINDKGYSFGFYKHRFVEYNANEINNMTFDQIISKIKEIITYNQTFKVEFYSNQIAFCIYENEVVISYTSEDNDLYIDCDLTEGRLDARVVDELSQIMRLLDDNKELLRKFCE